MSTFSVQVRRLEIEPHTNADALELAKVGEYRAVVKKGQFQTGDLALYIPEAAVVPDNILATIGLTGKLAGPQHNRVKAIKLRGAVSQGIVVELPAVAALLGVFTTDHLSQTWLFHEGEDYAQQLGITKWEPPIPTHLAGEVENVGREYLVKYDVENWKAYPNLLQEGEQVVVTEKIHGTFMQVAVLPDGTNFAASKGLGGQGLAFKDNERNAGNLYLRAAKYHRVAGRAAEFGFAADPDATAVVVMGEVFGRGVQDLAYGHDTSKDDTIGFRVFDVALRYANGTISYFGHANLDLFCSFTGLQRVPVLYVGPYSVAKLKELTSGTTAITGLPAAGKTAQIREGVVVRPTTEREDPAIGRVQLKSVSDAYLFRGGDQTEFN